MVHPTIHATPEAKLAAACEKHSCYYAREEDESESDPEAGSDDSQDSNDERNKLYNLPECLCIIKGIKDEMLAKINDPCTFTHNILCAYLKNLPEDSFTKADISTIEMPMTEVQKLLNHTIPTQDQILYFCGVLPEWYAADSVSHFLRTVLTYLEDIQYLVNYGGIPDLTLTHSMGELMYQKGIKILFLIRNWTHHHMPFHWSGTVRVRLPLRMSPPVHLVHLDWPSDYDDWDEVPLSCNTEVLVDKRKWYAADNPLLIWLPECQTFLNETIFLEGHGYETQ
ncbi:hypothetical protein BDR04DRAFT_1116732 [Suillus decipiens]|nr:hypothetical protein BDR04DRAFT_1116732 [Suillus decipiens]